jgi:hypothetical protein
MWCFAVCSRSWKFQMKSSARDWIAMIWRNFCTDTKEPNHFSPTIECGTEKVFAVQRTCDMITSQMFARILR